MKWYQKTGWILALLVLCFPLGCFLMWQYKKEWKTTSKAGASAVFAVFFLAVLLSTFSSDTSQTAALTDQLKTVQAEKQELETQIESLSADLSALNDENQTNAARIEELQDQLETAEQTIASMADSDSTEELQSQIDALQSENTKLTEENEKLAAQSASASNSSKSSPDATVSSGADAPSQPADTDSQIVLVTKTGSKYHNHKCGNGTYYEATLEDALARGLTPCKKCF
ncbi:hypothetical protein [Diplocloster agilis]|uniref:hypothetical protein n=1 Tax=Diplocloster agilis TaxID=2850323 RepID=UPI00082067D1|nr:hypothetical protein [Suonthocola fibrivorans]MCU6733018.1 hypothetical protein [Suonthocola fibrivorans]SCI72619.1 Uncharacterized protein conserved in bacteria with the myosin-like domain [uncultured Clostridium sp.]